MIIFNIKQIRESKGITQYGLAKKSGVARSYISELENNKRDNLSLEILLKIANVLEVNVKDLFYTELDLEELRQVLHHKIEKYGLSSKEALDVSQVIDLLINIKMEGL